MLCFLKSCSWFYKAFLFEFVVPLKISQKDSSNSNILNLGSFFSCKFKYQEHVLLFHFVLSIEKLVTI